MSRDDETPDRPPEQREPLSGKELDAEFAKARKRLAQLPPVLGITGDLLGRAYRVLKNLADAEEIVADAVTAVHNGKARRAYISYDVVNRAKDNAKSRHRSYVRGQAVATTYVVDVQADSASVGTTVGGRAMSALIASSGRSASSYTRTEDRRISNIAVKQAYERMTAAQKAALDRAAAGRTVDAPPKGLGEAAAEVVREIAKQLDEPDPLLNNRRGEP